MPFSEVTRVNCWKRHDLADAMEHVSISGHFPSCLKFECLQLPPEMLDTWPEIPVSLPASLEPIVATFKKQHDYTESYWGRDDRGGFFVSFLRDDGNWQLPTIHQGDNAGNGVVR